MLGLSVALIALSGCGGRANDLTGPPPIGAAGVAVIACVVAVAIALAIVVVAVPKLINPSSAIAAPQFPWLPAVAGLVAALIGSAAGALYPASVAARIEVALALRD
ncbi:MAG TPA: hypothetical protein VGO31_10460 [Microbacteriaceae bacterium]|nr:hypothetical protein [Microbacteriaceae bacterium]